MWKFLLFVALSFSLTACIEGKKTDVNNFESNIVKKTYDVLFLDNNIQISAEITERGLYRIIRTYIELPEGAVMYRFEDSDSDGSLDKVWDGQLCEYVEITREHQRIFALARRAIII